MESNGGSPSPKRARGTNMVEQTWWNNHGGTNWVIKPLDAVEPQEQ